ncbi:MAG: HAD family phosphatase [Planctomycetota bacterium]
MPGRDLFAFFDLGMVLVEFEHQRAVDQLAELAGRPPELVRQIAFDSGLEDRFETGLLSEQQYCQQINSALETSLENEDILEAVSSIFTLNEPILKVLELLRSEAIPMGILSNTCSAHWNWIAKQQWPVPGDWFEFAILSFEVGSMKPDSGIYDASEKRAGRSGAKLFFTDDRSENLEAANQRGWTTHFYDSAQKTEGVMRAVREWLERE